VKEEVEAAVAEVVVVEVANLAREEERDYPIIRHQEGWVTPVPSTPALTSGCVLWQCRPQRVALPPVHPQVRLALAVAVHQNLPVQRPLRPPQALLQVTEALEALEALAALEALPRKNLWRLMARRSQWRLGARRSQWRLAERENQWRPGERGSQWLLEAPGNPWRQGLKNLWRQERGSLWHPERGNLWRQNSVKQAVSSTNSESSQNLDDIMEGGTPTREMAI